MSYFDKIYSVTVKYRDKFQVIASELDALNSEKIKQAELTTYARRHRFIIENTIAPLITYLQSLSKQNKVDLESELEVLKAQAALKRRQLEDQYKERLKPLKREIEQLSVFLNELNRAIQIYDDEEEDQFNKIWLQLVSKYDLRGLKDNFAGYRTMNNLNEIIDQKQKATVFLKNKEDELSALGAKHVQKRHQITESLREKKRQIKKEFNEESPKKYQGDKSTIDELISLAKGIQSDLEEFGQRTADLAKNSLAINQKIRRVNRGISKLDLDISLIPELPEPMDDKILADLYRSIKSEINQVRSLYPQSKFNDALRVVSMIRHDISNERGYRAFSNRKHELVRITNQALGYFNTHTWQISGQRWERISGHTHGYKSVTPTHSEVELIS